MEFRKKSDQDSYKQRHIPRNRRNTGDSAVCEIGYFVYGVCACQGNLLILSLAAQRKKGLISVINRLT